MIGDFQLLESQTTEWQKKVETLEQCKKRGTKPAKLLKINKQVQQAASNVIISQKEWMAQQKELMAQRNAEIESLRARIQELEVNPMPPKLNPMKMEDEGKVAEFDGASSAQTFDDDESVEELIENCMILALKKYTISGQNMDNLLTNYENKLSAFYKDLMTTFYSSEEDGFKIFNYFYCGKQVDGYEHHEHPKFNSIGDDATNLGEVLAYLIKQKNNMNAQQQKRIYTFIQTFLESTKENSLEKVANLKGYYEVDLALLLAGQLKGAALELIVKFFGAEQEES